MAGSVSINRSSFNVLVYIEWPNLIHLGVTQNYFLVILVSGVDTLGVCALPSTPAVLFFENNS